MQLIFLSHNIVFCFRHPTTTIGTVYDSIFSLSLHYHTNEAERGLGVKLIGSVSTVRHIFLFFKGRRRREENRMGVRVGERRCLNFFFFSFSILSHYHPHNALSLSRYIAYSGRHLTHRADISLSALKTCVVGEKGNECEVKLRKCCWKTN